MLDEHDLQRAEGEGMVALPPPALKPKPVIPVRPPMRLQFQAYDRGLRIKVGCCKLLGQITLSTPTKTDPHPVKIVIAYPTDFTLAEVQELAQQATLFAERNR